MFYLIGFIDFCEYLLVLNFMAATCFTQAVLGQERQKAVKTLVGTVHRFTGHCHDWVWKGHPRKAQSFTSRAGALFATLSNTWMYKGDYCMSLRPLCKTVVCKHSCLQMIASFFIFTQQLNVFGITLIANEAVHCCTGWRVKIRIPLTLCSYSSIAELCIVY